MKAAVRPGKRTLKVQSVAARAAKPSRNATVFVLTALFLAGAALRLQHVADAASRSPDERVYVRNASRIADGGLREFPSVIQEYNRHPALWYYPPPTRTGYLTLLAATMKISGLHDEQAGAWLACAASIVSLVLIAWIGIRFLPLEAAVYAVFALAVSLPELTLARRCWQDSLLVMFGLGLTWASLEIVRNPHRRWTLWLLAAVGSLLVTIKETGASVYLICVAGVVMVLVAKRQWRALVELTIAGLIGAACATFSFLAAAGSWNALWSVWRHVSETHPVNDYANRYQDGSWWQFGIGLWLVFRVSLLLAAVTALYVSLPRNWRRVTRFTMSSTLAVPAYLFLGIVLSHILIMMSVTGAQNFRYFAPAYGPTYLAAGMGFWLVFRIGAQFASKLGRYRVFQAAVCTLVIWSAVAGYRDFVRIFVQRGVADLAIAQVLGTLR